MRKILFALAIVLFLFSICRAASNGIEYGRWSVDFPGFIGVIGASTLTILGFLTRRAIFKEIDDMKEKKQNKDMCIQIESVAQRDRDELCSDLKVVTKKVIILDKKIDLLMWAFKIENNIKEDE